MDVDIEFEIEKEAEAQFNFDQIMYDFDMSGITVEVKDFRILGQPSIKPKRLKTIDVIDKPNCTSVVQRDNFPQYTEVHTQSFSVTLGSKINWGSQVTGKLTIPGGLSIGSTRSQAVDLTAATTHTTTDTVELRDGGGEVVFPPCKRIRATKEVWCTEISGRVAVDVRIHGNVSYNVKIDLWPDPEYNMDLDFVTTIDGTFAGVGGHTVTGVYQESPAVGCSPPCRVQTANAATIRVDKPQIATSSHVATGLGFRSELEVAGVQGAVLEEPFLFEENPDRPLVINIGIIPDVQGFNETTGKSAMRIPLVGIAGIRKVHIPVTCQVPGELLGLEIETVPVTVVQPLRIEMSEA